MRKAWTRRRRLLRKTSKIVGRSRSCGLDSDKTQDLKTLEKELVRSRSILFGIKSNDKNKSDCFIKLVNNLPIRRADCGKEVNNLPIRRADCGKEIFPGQNPQAIDAFMKRCNLNLKSYIIVSAIYIYQRLLRWMRSPFLTLFGKVTMPRNDYQDTKHYIPPLLDDPNIPDEQKAHLHKVQHRYIHEGRVVDAYFILLDSIEPLGGPQRRTKQRKDKGVKRARKSTSDATLSSSSLPHESTSHALSEDDIDVTEEGTSRAQIPSPDTYLRDLNTSNFRTTTDLPFSNTNLGSVMRRQTVMYNRQVEMHEQTVGGFKSLRKAIKGIGKTLKKLGRSRN
ncbi:FAD-binding, type 1 [Artemisia annua]|uniref:FAD-binding, type 1 n=1 Tax=Artemisia annua TaxID=35608 RepID=A0A2U1KWL0_ARTAN|nr:FAD-binding, type 1 [Artemisia annua]